MNDIQRYKLTQAIGLLGVVREQLGRELVDIYIETTDPTNVLYKAREINCISDAIEFLNRAKDSEKETKG